MALRIVTDSTADLPREVAKEYGIAVVPVSVLFGDEELLDGVDITSDQFFRRLQREERLPTTSQPSAGAFRSTYERLVSEGATEILSLHVSGKLSGTVESARQGAIGVQGARIVVIDSLFVSAALGLAALAAGGAARQEASLDDSLRIVMSQLARTRLYFVLDTLEYLRRGGRIGRASELIGTLLRIKPILEVRDGEVHPVGRQRTRRKAIEDLLERVAGLRPIEQAMACHATTPDELQYLAERVRGYAASAPVITTYLGPAVGAHTGPGTLGVAIVTENESPPSMLGP